ncbi:sensor histidine kinase [Clostridium hydrogeniformans]|uniref:sensor histidine kinase n=1 Tax=Clostridium hydrogeniformans TaxID=349933 RepID=UPI0004839D7C|nr:HAMP domain-containing sensor histidine kinase [Clostridium hydrogeniformans]
MKKNLTSKSIKYKVVRNFLLVVIISVLLLELLIINFVKHYYYKNIEDLLTNQIKISSEIYSRYFSNVSLEENIIGDVDVFWKQTEAQVQIWNKEGKLLMDSSGLNSKEEEPEDIKKAILGGKGVWKGEKVLKDSEDYNLIKQIFTYNNSKVMAVSYPLKTKNQVVGAIRFITSLEEVNKSIYSISMVFVFIGLFVVLASSFVTMILANSIIQPIEGVTIAAEKMAMGDYKARSIKVNDDEIGKLSDTLNYMASEILKKEQLKNDFISNVSHELRTPLTSIKGWAITLQYDDIDKNMVKDGLNIIEQECDRLSGMVEELLDFSKFVSGQIVLSKKSVNVNDILNYVKNHMNARADREGIKFTLKVEENTRDINLDVNRIKQVLINIIDNALKFTDKGGSVTLRAKSTEDYLEITVLDSGCGISEADLPKVKEKFYKGKSSKSKNGIGLSICDEIIKLHNGKFIIESKIKEGTKVIIMLPYDR